MVRVDQDKCIGCGLCVGMAPEVFVMNADYKSEVINTESTDAAREAAASCPVDAIIL
ncbi:MAG: ferredoxin [bacterium]|nr:ferredoxin [bacterium]